MERNRIAEAVLAFFLACALSLIIVKLCFAVARADTTNVVQTMLMVDQHGRLNVDGVASVTDVATNAANVQIANAKAETARLTAQSVTNELQGIVANIMANNVYIYRKGYVDAFAGLIIIGPNDKLIICGFTHTLSGSTLSGNIEYACTADIGLTKPQVWADGDLGDAQDFVKIPDAQVQAPTLHNEPKTIGGITYARWYDIDFTMTVDPTTRHFYLIKLDPDAPSGDGATLELPNGITGGKSGEFTFGDKILTYTGGVLTGVRNAN